ncbi:MAG: maltose alpha-D-glucosyltransferase [Myxococcota bacterium]
MSYTPGSPTSPPRRRTAALPRKHHRKLLLAEEPQWYRDAIIYELHVRAFHDSDGDGIGDFRGLTRRLDYLQDLGVTAVWLLPFYPSPLLDDGYDIADYRDIHPSYGTLRDFREFLYEAHRRGLRVITELVINHTSDQHPWFQKARRAPPGSRWREFYVWSVTPERYADARVIFEDFEHSNWAWDPVAKAYYWHRFYSHQPDLNFENPEVHEAVFEILDYWMEMGVDGVRLDAVPYLYQEEGTNCENLPRTHDFLKTLRAHVDERFGERMLLAEANQWPEDAVAYFGEGDECHMNFHFPLMPRLFMALEQEDRFSIVDILDQTPELPEGCQWATFLRNHDELTLEMVTDEERDSMYRAYARHPRARVNLGIRRRLAPLLQNNRARIELMNGLLFSLPGTPVLYYGDEIGMGDNIYLGDRNSVRTPMQWSADRNAGFSRANPQQLYLPVIIDPEYTYSAVNVEVQQDNASSLLWWMRRLIALTKRYRAFGRGSITFLDPDNRKILAFLREYEDEVVLVVANLSRFAGYCELDLSRFKGRVPVELFGRTPMPAVGDLPYLLTLAPHAFYWLSLETTEDGERPWAMGSTWTPVEMTLPLAERWHDLFEDTYRARLERALEGFLEGQRWFRRADGVVRDVRVRAQVRVPMEEGDAWLLILGVQFVKGEEQSYLLPLAFASGPRAEQILHGHYPVVARLRLASGTEGFVYDAVADPDFTGRLLELFDRRHHVHSGGARLHGDPTPVFKELRDAAESLEPRVIQTERADTGVVYGNRLYLKVMRRIEPGESRHAEIVRALTERGFRHVPRLAGVLMHTRDRGPSTTLAVLQEYVPNEGDALQYTLDSLQDYFETLLMRGAAEGAAPEAGRASTADRMDALGSYLASAELLGQRLADMHLVLAEDTPDPAFRPEPFSKLYQRSLYQSMRNLVGRVFDALRRRVEDLPEEVCADARRCLELREAVMERLRAVTGDKIDAVRTRIHGDLHLGEVLHTGNDFIITGVLEHLQQPVGERRIKRSPLRDVASMVRSFHYAAYSALNRLGERGLAAGRSEDDLRDQADFWYDEVRDAFLMAYLERAADAPFVPADEDATNRLLKAFLVEKAVLELGHELEERPEWLVIPLHGLFEMLGEVRHA